jgi:hypothetical protein
MVQDRLWRGDDFTPRCCRKIPISLKTPLTGSKSEIAAYVNYAVLTLVRCGKLGSASGGLNVLLTGVGVEKLSRAITLATLGQRVKFDVTSRSD